MVRPSRNSSEDGGKVAHLLKGMYGLKQAGRQWHKKLTLYFEGMGFTRSQIDHSVFFRTRGDQRLVIPVSIDDMAIAGFSIIAVS
jgi:hypothetical protein